MQSPRSPLDWEWESQSLEPEHTACAGMPAESDAAVLSTLQALQAEVATLGKNLQLDRNAVAKTARRGLLGGLLHALDMVLGLRRPSWTAPHCGCGDSVRCDPVMIHTELSSTTLHSKAPVCPTGAH